MRPYDPDLESFHFVPVDPRAELRFRRWNLIIITLLVILVVGLSTIGLLPGIKMRNSVSASHTTSSPQHFNP
jgi:hypothetical protein